MAFRRSGVRFPSAPPIPPVFSDSTYAIPHLFPGLGPRCYQAGMKPRPIWIDVLLLAGILFALYAFAREPDAWLQLRAFFRQI